MKNTNFRKPNIYKTNCPSCNETIHIDEFQVDEDEVIDCPECWTLLQIVSVQPFKVIEHFDENDFEWV